MASPPCLGAASLIRMTPTPPPLPRVISRLPSDPGRGIRPPPSSPPPIPPPPRSRPPRRRARLVLHFDINETILVGDDAGGDTREDCLNKVLAKSAFVRIDRDRGDGCGGGSGAGEGRQRGRRRRQPTLAETAGLEPTRWWDGSPIRGGGGNGGGGSDPPPPPPPPLYTGWEWPPGCCPYYRTAHKRRAKTFTRPGCDGAAYRPLYDEMERRLSLAERGLDGSGIDEHHPFHHMLPAFFRTLVELTESGRDFTLVLRTFGTDLEDVARALSVFATGGHPAYPDFRSPGLVLGRDGMFRGRWRRADGTGGAAYELREWDERDYVVRDAGGTTTVSGGDVAASGDEEALSLLEGRSVAGIQDDYRWWSESGCDPRAGKPVWVRRGGDGGGADDGKPPPCHHILFDDNIHNDPTDSIAAVRCSEGEGGGGGGGARFRSLSGEEIASLHGRHLVRVPTVEPVLDEGWFLRRIEAAEAAVWGDCDSARN